MADAGHPDSQFSFTDGDNDGLCRSNLSKFESNEELMSFGIDYDDDAILAFNPALRDNIGDYPVANYTPSSDWDLQHNAVGDMITLNSSLKDEINNTVQGADHFTSSENQQYCPDILSIPHNFASNGSNAKQDLTSVSLEKGTFNTTQKTIGENTLDVYPNMEAKSHGTSTPFQKDQVRSTSSCGVNESRALAFGQERAVQRLTAKIVAEIKAKVPKLDTIKQELLQMQEDVKSLRSQFSEIGGKCRKVSNAQNRTIICAKSFINTLDLVIYQNKIINHLNDAVNQMKVFECHVTADRKIVFVDPNDEGTDVDFPAHTCISVSRSSDIVDSEFKRGFTIPAPD